MCLEYPGVVHERPNRSKVFVDTVEQADNFCFDGDIALDGKGRSSSFADLVDDCAGFAVALYIVHGNRISFSAGQQRRGGANTATSAGYQKDWFHSILRGGRTIFLRLWHLLPTLQIHGSAHPVSDGTSLVLCSTGGSEIHAELLPVIPKAESLIEYMDSRPRITTGRDQFVAPTIARLVDYSGYDQTAESSSPVRFIDEDIFEESKRPIMEVVV